MHSIWTRANTIFAFTLTVLTAATLLAFFSTSFNSQVTNVTLKAENVRVRSVADYSSDDGNGKSDLAMPHLTIHADMTPIFNWNVKMVFMYLVAEYSTMKNVVNEVVLWDRIMMRTDNHVVLEEAINPKYYFLDDGSNLLSHQNVTLVLKWNIIPNAGRLSTAQGNGSFVVKMPSSYHSSRW